MPHCRCFSLRDRVLQDDQGRPQHRQSQVSAQGEDAGRTTKNGDDLQVKFDADERFVHTHVCCVEKKDFQLHIVV